MQKNFLVVSSKTEKSTIEQAFDRFTHDRKDIAILLINQHVSLSKKGDLKKVFSSVSSRSLNKYDTELTITPKRSRHC